MVTGRRLTSPKRCSTAASIKSRTSSPLTPLVVARKLMASRSQQREGDPHPLTVVAADLKAIGAPAAVARIDGDASVMSPLDAAGMAIKQQTVDLHHPVNPLVIGRLQASGQRLALEDGVDTSVAVGWQLGDDRLDLCHEFVVWQRRPANPFLRSLSHAFDQ